MLFHSYGVAKDSIKCGMTKYVIFSIVITWQVVEKLYLCFDRLSMNGKIYNKINEPTVHPEVLEG